MIERVYIHVAGPRGSGKTLLTEALLRGVRGPLICVRAVCDLRARGSRESDPTADPELRRYRNAGAEATAVYRFPPEPADPLRFFESRFMQEYSRAVVLEGDCPVEFVDLEVFVAPPPAPGQTLLGRIHVSAAEASAARAATLTRIIQAEAGWRSMGAPAGGRRALGARPRVRGHREGAPRGGERALHGAAGTRRGAAPRARAAPVGPRGVPGCRAVSRHEAADHRRGCGPRGSGGFRPSQGGGTGASRAARRVLIREHRRALSARPWL